MQYLAKRLICLSYGTKRTLLLKIETCNLHINTIYTKVYLFIYLTLVCLIPSHKETDELIHEIFLWYLRANCRPKNSNLLYLFIYLFFFIFFFFFCFEGNQIYLINGENSNTHHLLYEFEFGHPILTHIY